MEALKPYLFFFLLLPSWLFAQIEASGDSLPQYTIQVQAKCAAMDPSGNLYLVSKTNQLYKYNTSGKLLSTLNYSYQGNIESVDASNPLEIYVWYRELNKVVFLDNNLAYRGECDLTAFGCVMPSAVARSYDNGLWVFDLADMQLKKFTKEGKSFFSSGNLKQYTQVHTFSPSWITDNGKEVLLADQSVGIFVFDLMGNYSKTVSAKPTSAINSVDKDWFFFNSGEPVVYRSVQFKTNKINLHHSIVGQPIYLTNLLLITFTKDDVRCYKR